ncbi:thioredoxin-dependent thiol peroxidase [Halopelagius longus]|uniref:thioredoxin-dependent peroxiredoxin n=1 Tax=Halopelagius longus TaxID=1236180 RepID=A0A1H0YZX9_9EURY|nr:thioredoxin-dependent thiol peroxidase [Halopelagius longus]RDI72757.1 thioredoxin-dependent thiol peroxidase [Halopelagius longus]SDQ20674.1 peroxiredoxin Q/BCP [Halopelagius longus]
MLSVGDEAPDFELQDQDGETVSLSDYRGDYVVVYFYPRANTPGCTTEACGFRDEWDEFEKRDVAVLGVSDDPVSDLKEFEDDHDLPFPLLSDEDGEVASAYDSYGEKNMFGNTFDGVFRNTYVVGPDGDIVLAYEGVSPEGHAEEILSDVEELDA